MIKTVRAAIEAIDDTLGGPESSYPEDGEAQIAETPSTDRCSRLIVRRTRLLGPQARSCGLTGAASP